MLMRQQNGLTLKINICEMILEKPLMRHRKEAAKAALLFSKSLLKK